MDKSLSWVVLSTIKDAYLDGTEDGEQLVAEILVYLYKQSIDDDLKHQIVSSLSSMNYCLDCASRLNEENLCDICDRSF